MEVTESIRKYPQSSGSFVTSRLTVLRALFLQLFVMNIPEGTTVDKVKEAFGAHGACLDHRTHFTAARLLLYDAYVSLFLTKRMCVRDRKCPGTGSTAAEGAGI